MDWVLHMPSHNSKFRQERITELDEICNVVYVCCFHCDDNSRPCYMTFGRLKKVCRCEAVVLIE